VEIKRKPRLIIGEGDRDRGILVEVAANRAEAFSVIAAEAAALERIGNLSNGPRSGNR
jgi:hypothetical protein